MPHTPSLLVSMSRQAASTTQQAKAEVCQSNVGNLFLATQTGSDLLVFEEEWLRSCYILPRKPEGLSPTEILALTY